MINEDELEKLALFWFQEAGWNYIPGPDLAPGGDSPERADFHSVILKERLSQAVAGLNPKLTATAVEEVVNLVSKPHHPVLMENNYHFHRLLVDGLKMDYTNGDGDKDVAYVQLIDFQNPHRNNFLVVNQFTVTSGQHKRRPDVVVFVNGLPLAVLELKNPADERTDMWSAFNQLQTYKQEIEDLFTFNQALIISDGLQARVGSLSAGAEWFLPWRAVEDEDDKPFLQYELETVVRGFFDPERFLAYVQHFILFERGNGLIKKIAGYHQFHGVREAVRVTLQAALPPDGDVLRQKRATYGDEVVAGSKKAGVFWHTQGSGKSISMCFYAGLLLQQPQMGNPTLVVVTDRNDLDGQLFKQFTLAQDLLKQTPQQAESRTQLRDLLAARQTGGVIFTTVQKFSLAEGEISHPVLCDRDNVVVISDEAHRSQYGLKAKLNKSGDYRYGFAKHMRDALPQAAFIGFTGTPIDLEDKDTRVVFGDYVSIYDIEDAVKDRATVKIYYESRLAKMRINREDIDELNREVEEVVEDEEETADREKVKSRWTTLSKLVGAEARLEEVAADLNTHFEMRNQALIMKGSPAGKAMIVCMSRDICVSMFDALIALNPQWAGTRRDDAGWDFRDGALRVVMTGTAADSADLQAHVYTAQQKKKLADRFKDPDDPLKLVIVRDMWLTGFDAPVCHTLYVDKPMQGHNLAQAIARVNRVFRDKPGGLVVDYIGIAGALREVMRVYAKSKGKGAPTVKVEEALALLLEKLDVVRGLMHGFDYSAYQTQAMILLPQAANHILGLADGKKRFGDAVVAMGKAFSLCSTMDEAAALQVEIAFFGAVKAALVKSNRSGLSEAARDAALRKILDNSVETDGVLDIFEMVNLERPQIGLLSEEFLEGIRDLPGKNLAVELLDRLLRDDIQARFRTNVVQEKKYSDRLKAAIARYNNRPIETAQVIEELLDMARDFHEAVKREEALGLSKEEIAFYDALAENPLVLKEMKSDILKQLAIDLTEKLRRSTTVDWQERDSVRAKMRILVKRLLRKYKYPPKGLDDAVKRVIEQAEVLADSWSS